jgi:FlaA1/EpsC-like NDP-sugar epimerase
MGAQNIIEASIYTGVKKVLGIGSDKAVNPINLYGATKLVADKLFMAASAYATAEGTKFSVIRFGNFYGSRGSVVTVPGVAWFRYSRIAKVTYYRLPISA